MLKCLALIVQDWKLLLNPLATNYGRFEALTAQAQVYIIIQPQYFPL